MTSTNVVLLAVNNSPAVSSGYCEPNFTMRVKDLNTVGKAITLESAQFELRFKNYRRRQTSSTSSRVRAPKLSTSNQALTRK